jgi:hypothetical protein
MPLIEYFLSVLLDSSRAMPKLGPPHPKPAIYTLNDFPLFWDNIVLISFFAMSVIVINCPTPKKFV